MKNKIFRILKLNSLKLVALSFSILVAFCASCSNAQQFNAAEEALIKSVPEGTAMRVLSIANHEDSLILRKTSIDLDVNENKVLLQYLLKNMLQTMQAEEGIGIAAPQVGINRNVFLFTRIHEKDQKVQVAINPKIIAHSDTMVCFQRDGCLSIPDIRGNSKRYAWIEVAYEDENGKKIKEKLSGFNRPDDFTNIIFQHEFDHINGVLFIDKLCE